MDNMMVQFFCAFWL